jgi:hypothetical protein
MIEFYSICCFVQLLQKFLKAVTPAGGTRQKRLLRHATVILQTTFTHLLDIVLLMFGLFKNVSPKSSNG